jgi:hypothetical protein
VAVWRVVPGTRSTGGTGGGGAGGINVSTQAVAGTANLGGGGGGMPSSTYGAAGGSGVVIISYAGSQVFIGGTVTSSGGNTIHTFTSSGSLVPAYGVEYLVVAGGGGGGAILVVAVRAGGYRTGNGSTIN